MKTDSFVLRHVGPQANEVEEMIKTIGVSSIDELIYNTIPDDILLKNGLNLPDAMSEFEYMSHIQELADKNTLFKNHYLNSLYLHSHKRYLKLHQFHQ